MAVTSKHTIDVFRKQHRFYKTQVQHENICYFRVAFKLIMQVLAIKANVLL